MQITKIDSDINVIKAQIELASGVVIQWFKENIMQENSSKFQALCVSKTVKKNCCRIIH